jgi:3-deoxy-D-manno-octulosonic-acid transferase
MYLLYSAFLVFWGILLIPFFLYRAWRYHKRLPGLGQRLGKLPPTLDSDGRPTIWFHACSVGETLSLQPLLHALAPMLPGTRFVFSTITETGQMMAQKNFAVYGPGNIFYFPVDLASIVKRVLAGIRPAMIVIIDTEIWPNLIHHSRRQGIPVVLANGRISAKSYRQYRWAKPFLGRVFRNYRLLMMQSGEDSRRIGGMGAPPEKIVMTGNMKFDKSVLEQETSERALQEIETGFLEIGANAPLIVAGSTHEGEEEVLFQVLRRIRTRPGLNRTRLLLAPRHPERFAEVAEKISRSGFTLRKRTDASGQASEADVFLLDTLGELAAAYRFATVAFVGGTLDRRGGHSIMEPALYAKAIVVGPSMQNFRGIVDEFLAHDAIRQITAGGEDRKMQIEQLTAAFVDLLEKPQVREKTGKAALSILEKNRGAARVAAEHIASIFREQQKDQRSPKGASENSRASVV